MAYQSGNAMQVTIQGPGPWGFRLAGGRDFNTPIHISKITPGGKAARSNLLPNDTVTAINGCDTSNYTHLEAQNKIKGAVGDLALNISRGDAKIWKPKITDDFGTSSPSVNVSLTADKQKFTHAGSSHNVAAKPFPGSAGGGPPGGGLGTATVVHKQFNSPVGIYSSENIAETFKGQTEGMITGALGGESSGPIAGGGGGGGGGGSNYDTGSPVYQALHEPEQSSCFGQSNPGTQSRSFKMLQQMTESDNPDFGSPPPPPPQNQAGYAAHQPATNRAAGTRSVKAPTAKPGGGSKPDSTLPMCEGCNRAIVGQCVNVNPPDEERPKRTGPFVKVRNRSLHPECFKCGTCGCSLRNQGYFWVEGGMYCERDAKAKATPPPGANVVMSSNAPGNVPNGAPRNAPAPHNAPQQYHSAQQHTPQQHAPQQHAPQAHAPQQHAPQQHAPQQHAPQQHAPQTHAPQTQRTQPGPPRGGGPPRSQPVPANKRNPTARNPRRGKGEQVKQFSELSSYNIPRNKRQPNPQHFAVKPPPPLVMKKKALPDPNEIIAKALAKNPDSTKEPTPPPPTQPKPRFQMKPQADPNAIIAKALAKNPGSTQDCLGIQPVFSVEEHVKHEVTPETQRPAPRPQPKGPRPPGAPEDGVRVMFLPNNGAGASKQTPSQVAQQRRAAPQHTPSPPRSSGPPQAPQQAYRPGGGPSGQASYNPPAAPRGGTTAPPPSKMVDSGTRTPVCDGCNSIIKGPFVSAIGRNWHPEHFVCTHCHENLKNKTFVEEKGKIYCEEDFVKLFAEKCSKCGTNIGGPGVTALGGKYHPECFVCEQCKEPIAGGAFRLSDGKPYCEKDYRAMHSTMCSGCEFIIDPGDPWLEALDKAWHANCFVCSICQSALEGQSFYAKMGRPFCQAHAN